MNSVRDIADSELWRRFWASDVLNGVVEVPEDGVGGEELPADAEITEVSIPTARTMSDHVLYKVSANHECAVVSHNKRRVQDHAVC